jgi:putative FmdB family regulatory protein
MPIYEYHCNTCGTDFEKLVFGSTIDISCDKCGSKNTAKLVSRFGMGRSSNTSSSGDTGGGSGCGGCSSSSCAGCK